MKLSSLWVTALAMWVGSATGISATEAYGPVTAEETLSQIAIKFRPQPLQVSTCQTALAIYWANPDAFLGSIHKLKPGAQLTLPSAAEIESVDARLAVRLYSDPSYAFPRVRPAGLQRAATAPAVEAATAIEAAARPPAAVAVGSPAPSSPPDARPQKYGPVQAQETLHSIAMKHRPERSAQSTTQTVLALYWANPGAFGGSVHGLKPGSILLLPDAATIRAVDPQLAAKLYSEPAFAFPTAPPGHSTHPVASTADVEVAALAALPLREPPTTTDAKVESGPVVATPAVEALAEAPAITATPIAPPPAVPAAIEVAATARDSTPGSAPTPSRSGNRVRPSPAARAGSSDRRRPGEANPRPAPPALTVSPNRDTELLPVPPPPQPWLPEAWTKAPIPDRWRLLNALDLVPQRWFDPYNQNTWKGDKPVRNGDEFLILSAIFDGIWEPRKFPQPVGPQGTTRPGSLGIFGRDDNTLVNTNIILSAVYLKGDTTFKPPDWEYHFVPVISFNYARNDEARVLETSPGNGTARTDSHIGIQELFVDYHLYNVSDRYDFDSLRVGIQPFSSDFRGFLFQDNQLMLRYFGTRDNNLWQFNLVWMRRLEKDTNTALNAIERPLREDDTYLVNVYRQDWPVLGFISQGIVAHNRNREGDGRLFFNDNGFVERPASLGSEGARAYQVTYYGYNGDGHFGRLNLTVSAYLAQGREDRGVFTNEPRDILATFAAAEASFDQDWIRWRLSAMVQSGDDDPFDDEANGFDSIFDNPIFAGADTSFWFRQSVPLIGGGIVNLSQRNSLLNNLRSSKEHGQSNFANPGLILLGVGNDLDLSPQVRLSFNFNHLWFEDTTTLEVARNQESIREEIGFDLSTALIWRPFFQQNVIFRLSGAYLIPGDGFKDLFPDEDGYSVLGNLILTY